MLSRLAAHAFDGVVPAVPAAAPVIAAIGQGVGDQGDFGKASAKYFFCGTGKPRGHFGQDTVAHRIELGLCGRPATCELSGLDV